MTDKLEETRRDYNDGDRVAVEVQSLGTITGTIVGKSVAGVADLWIIEYDSQFRDLVHQSYPFRTFTAPHGIIRPINH